MELISRKSPTPPQAEHHGHPGHDVASSPPLPAVAWHHWMQGASHSRQQGTRARRPARGRRAAPGRACAGVQGSVQASRRARRSHTCTPPRCVLYSSWPAQGATSRTAPSPGAACRRPAARAGRHLGVTWGRGMAMERSAPAASSSESQACCTALRACARAPHASPMPSCRARARSRLLIPLFTPMRCRATQHAHEPRAALQRHAFSMPRHICARVSAWRGA